MWIVDHFETFWEQRKAIWCIETQLAERLLQIRIWKSSKISSGQMFYFFKIFFFIFLLLFLLLLFLIFFKVEFNLKHVTFVDKSLPGKRYRNVDKSDYHDDIDILTCEDINGALLGAVKMSCFLFHGHLQYYHNCNTSRICDIKTATAILRQGKNLFMEIHFVFVFF